ncbi:prolipoprotein diacylglyceryl transferase [candidate division FCPU426 bacterium]|nr:prolipoprotein diacylglyceryl transferase [candidate division FCPU426 bacterium]
MHPILFSIGPLTLRSYGFFVALGFALAIYLAWRQAKKEGIDPDHFLDMSLWVVISGIVGARLMYVLVSWDEFVAEPLAVFKIWEGGLVFYGGFIAAVLAAVFFCRQHRLPIWKVLDASAPYAALGHAFGRIGCFFNGCCYGLVHPVFGVVFPNLQDNLPRIPTQLLESLGNALLFLALLFLKRRRRFDGQVFWAYILLYACLRFFLEFLRGDEIRGNVFFPWLHTSQLIALLGMFLSAGVMWYVARKKPIGK